MKKFVLEVPKGIRYISEWKEFKTFPETHILDKKIPGCGFTEWVLTNDEDIILCSPRLMLIDNKADQHKDELLVVKGSGVELGVDIDMEDKSPDTQIFLSKILQEEDQTIPEAISTKLKQYKAFRKDKPLKIITTYDSFKVLRDVLEFNKILDKFHIYVDEFQSIFTDSRFKADTEMTFVNSLQDLNPCYVSATPMMEDYLELIPEFSNLPYIELDWEKLDLFRVCKPNLKARTCGSIITEAVRVINSYKNKDYDKIIRPDGSIVESKEATLFVNSVNNITKIINKARLSPDQVNILCANTEENQNKIRTRLGKGFEIGTVPLKGEPRKMITICTRTVYLGADFYSDNSRTFIFSDASIETLSVDISLDLPQILGRQRLDSNPWRNTAEFYYKIIFHRGQEKKTLTQELIDDKLEESNKIINSLTTVTKDRDALMRALIRSFRSDRYKSSYAAINYLSNGEMEVVINSLVLISEQRAFDIQNIDYADRFTMFSSIDKVLGTNTVSIGIEMSKFWNEYKKLTRKEDKLKLIYNSHLSEDALEQVKRSVEMEIRNYLALGLDRIKALSFDLSLLNGELKYKFSENDLTEKVYQEFKVGLKISKKELKERLKNIYTSIGINKTAKATDIDTWFETKESQYRVNGKKVAGFELIKKLK